MRDLGDRMVDPCADCRCLEHWNAEGRLTEVEFVEDRPIHGRESEEWGWQWRAHDDWLDLVADLENPLD